MGHTGPKMSKLIIGVFSLLGLISACLGQGVVQTGSCDENINVVTNFNANNYLGVWYDIESLPSTFQTGTCNTATYGSNTDGSISVQNTQVSGGILSFATGTATAQTGVAAGTAKFNVLIGSNTDPVPYWVLDTDYETFALVYSCVNVAGTNTRRVNSWKLGRNKGELPTAATSRINSIINNVPALLAASPQYVVRDHTAEACSYFVDVAGTCPTVTGVANFDLNSYLGTWYEVARYPQTSQTGQCNRAEYSQGTGVVNVQNSQVINQALGTISGTATTTAQSGVLAVTFNIGGVPTTQNLVVLATDYQNYALLYSCVDLGGNRRRIGSWQLRKNFNELSAAATADINNAITNNADLEVAYYQQTSQTNAACFYYPDPADLPDFIDLPGPCDTTITGVADFDVDKYLGTWYEVARFPQSAQTGQCNRAVYSQGAGVVNVQNSQVTNQVLGTISGTATTTAQSGVLAVILNVGGEPRSQNLHVLATDYDNYALLYSCINIEGNKRRVGSWQLRKNFEPPTAAAINAINTAIAETEGLRADYYRVTSQTDAACFYYPDFNDGELIELPGSCDTTIAGVANFEVNRYLGTWYEVARFPQTAQTGQCNRAVYAQGATTGVYTVQNSQVTNQALGTISGEARATSQSGVLEVTFTIGGEPRSQNLHVLATDYDNYALVYSCVNIEGNRRRVGSWQLRKNFEPLTAAATNAINTAIANTEGLRENYYQETRQTDAACFYYPDFNDGELIELPGSCDTTIAGVANFEVNRYLGTWYEVARFPQTAQTGQCNRAVYAQGATTGVYTVQNSQVTNQALGTISGEARATSQSGVLEVTFTIGGEPRSQNLHVLATDYDNYALVYSCVNIEGNRRRVGSWQLRKNFEPLTAAATNAINTAIANTEGLRENYYQETRQTDAACFYYPDFNDGELIELPGPCDTSIAGVPDFDVTRYLGTWLEVARFPQTTQTGQCNRAEYSQGTGVVTVLNSQVISEALFTISGQATTTAQSGVLAVTLNVGGVPTTTNLHVLATDYDSYALAYTCTNIEGNRRRVGSWQLRRNLNPLTEAATNAINNAISNTEGLRADYYQVTQQTIEACWHYLPQAGEKVIIPGQCDTQITGVANINTTRFANNIWYHINRYDAVGERSCIGTRLTVDGNYINVNYIEVIGEEAKRLEGIARLSDAATGKFDLEMTDSEEKEEIYILATDYDNYAIAYSCKNEGTETRQIGAWQLSRTRSWPAVGNTALQRLIAERQEITDVATYFKAVPHNEQCPEPSSAFLFRSSIIVIFVCAVLNLVW